MTFLEREEGKKGERGDREREWREKETRMVASLSTPQGSNPRLSGVREDASAESKASWGLKYKTP